MNVLLAQAGIQHIMRHKLVGDLTFTRQLIAEWLSDCLVSVTMKHWQQINRYVSQIFKQKPLQHC